MLAITQRANFILLICKFVYLVHTSIEIRKREIIIRYIWEFAIIILFYFILYYFICESLMYIKFRSRSIFIFSDNIFLLFWFLQKYRGKRNSLHYQSANAELRFPKRITLWTSKIRCCFIKGIQLYWKYKYVELINNRINCINTVTCLE